MCTFMDNMGTVLEHVLLCEVMEWLATGGIMKIQCLDTHTMSPLNASAGPGSPPQLVSRLFGQPENQIPTGGTPGVSAYISTLRRPGVSATTYPTCFVHAARVASKKEMTLRAYLFEQDSAKRSAISVFLTNTSAVQSLGINPNLFTGTLAGSSGVGGIYTGGWRDVAGWPALRVCNAEALVIMSDPMKLTLSNRRKSGADMDLADLNTLSCLVNRFEPVPPVIAHVMFLGSNIRCHRGLFESVFAQWQASVARGMAAIGFGVQWGGFQVFIGIACPVLNHGQSSFPNPSVLRCRLDDSLGFRSLYRPGHVKCGIFEQQYPAPCANGENPLPDGANAGRGSYCSQLISPRISSHGCLIAPSRSGLPASQQPKNVAVDEGH